MKILVTGYNGQLGYDVVKRGEKQGLEMQGIGIEDLDITNEAAVYEFVDKVKPDAIIHCAAYTAVDKSEDDKELCWNVNVEGTKYLATAAKKLNAKFVYISTDYVFDGEGTHAFVETDAPNPVGYYGLTKYEGEKIVRSLIDNNFIVRISWVFGINGNNFIKTMLRLGETRNELNVVGDQIGSPTYTYDLARLLVDMVVTEKYGTYHATNEGFCSWAEFAQEIFEIAGQDVKVNSITTEEYPTRAVRPKNSRMSKQKLIDNGFEPLQDWKKATKHYITQLQQEVK
ncbi:MULTISPECIES: dTDP-4-dehydrorhamnose reductase [Bacillus cereus group]|uniref:dTDP-4-dehydrorhamnose reductase n=1 Tax=Bacillus thuringiensis TaxID=1428 RepID=A0A1C4GJ11_BACTU|nr:MULTISPECIES: dTDP-4-dehydrorhamnose reductase [Bacillus cereus group]MCC2326259.1 dTDP-4-dehydrorhamnose reductase [Bacillus wiedmannii]MED2011764.1 dTDP-4-dehydrorhamnose reductase [Bacillus wiedmannii]MED3020996.1 dTDP-4-dehydrorhamnose reductase [Bacillus wiedmannii]OTX94963.1 dTDP-4-dehydrorhamnose reductase [Bacillus thuringiensis serovar wratislaviensis]OUB54025.1 dTDP-4-dehydrorhamnose reductase [Bacillus thuringiensis serovar sylvestriensis]